MENWYAVKAVFRTDVTAPGATVPRLSSFEERVVLFRAASFNEALQRAEEEAQRYAEENRWRNDQGEDVCTRYLDALDAFSLSDKLDDGAELYSKILVVNPETRDGDVVERTMGSEAEQASPSSSSFEPDFERISAR
jgi:hypothetical protein